MTTDPYHINGPAVISFSGGRTSGYMLWHILDRYDGKLPDDVHVIFANTGKEMPETLDFIQECSERWNVKVTWLEYDANAEYQTKTVNHNSASRNGEPFKSLIVKKSYLPNPLMRFCTIELKIRRIKHQMHKVHGYKRWGNVIGLRYDEPRRYLKRTAESDKKDRWDTILPLVYADVTARDVAAWWEKQSFDLRLENINGNAPYGNCDLCFLKGAKTITGIMRDRPDLAEWWIDIEALLQKNNDEDTGATFRIDRPKYSELLDIVQRQGDLFDDGVGSIDCMCTD